MMRSLVLDKRVVDVLHSRVVDVFSLVAQTFFFLVIKS
jgi:hypothetical protein